MIGKAESDMTRRHLALALTVATATTILAPEGRAQSGLLEPAETIRVVERSDRWSGDVAREVVDDLDPREILLVQVALEETGFGVGAFTARLDGATRGALRRFQIQRGLSICGCVSYETVVALGVVPRVVDARYAHRAADRHPVVIVVPDRRKDHHHHGSTVVVGAGGNPGVFVGHRPARGSGSDRRHVDRRPTRPRPDGSVGRRTPVRPRAGERIRGGDGRAGSDRPSRPRPR